MIEHEGDLDLSGVTSPQGLLSIVNPTESHDDASSPVECGKSGEPVARIGRVVPCLTL